MANLTEMDKNMAAKLPDDENGISWHHPAQAPMVAAVPPEMKTSFILTEASCGKKTSTSLR